MLHPWAAEAEQERRPGQGGGDRRSGWPMDESRTTGACGRYRWLVCTLLFFAVSVLYVDRQILSLLKPMLDDQMKWTDEQFGLINAAFLGAYGLSAAAFGWFIDRFGTKIGYTVVIVAWSLSAVGTSFAAGVRGFVLARFAVGGSEGGSFPTSIKAVALWFPKGERALATTIFNSGTNVGAIIAPAVIPWIAFRWGWQGAYIAAGAAGLFWVVWWLLLYDRPENIRRLKPAELAHIRGDGAEEADNGAADASWARLLRYRQTWSFILGKFFTDPIWWFFLIWLPDFFKKTRGLDLKRSWLHLVSIYAIVTALSIIGGWLTGFLIGRRWTVTRARKTGMLLFAACVLPILAVSRVGNWTVVLLVGVAAAAHQAWSANLFTTVSDMFPKGFVASVTGLGGMAGAIGSMLFQPFVGALLDFFKIHGGPAAGYNVLFTICGTAYLTTFVIHHLCAPRFDPIELRPQASGRDAPGG